MIGSVKFRGEDRDVEYRDYGYDPDTNVHEIEWHFVDDELANAELTEEEGESIYIQLAERSGEDRWPDDVI